MKPAVLTILSLLLALWLAVSLGDVRSELKGVKTTLKETTEYYEKSERDRKSLQAELVTASHLFQAELKANAKLSADAVAKLNADNRRLSVRLKRSEASTSTGACGDRPVSDDRAELHPETAASLIRITRDADSQVKALQETINILNKGVSQ